MPPNLLDPKGVAWVGLFAANLPMLAAYYEHKVGLRVVEQADGCCIFDAGSDTFFEIWGKGFASPTRKGAHEQSMLIGFLVDRLEPIVEMLKVRGLEPDTAIDSYLGTRWIYFTDPEGNRFSLKDRRG